ncbi:MAG: TonB-dependent receptor [Cyclobacteriaceae bacterium]|nr:TonB-dependent receptor [Cyclobacteriaceae bacterium]
MKKTLRYCSWLFKSKSKPYLTKNTMLSLLFATVSLFQVQAKDTVLRNDKVSLSFTNAPLKEVFAKLESKTAYRFFYNQRIVENTSQVTLSFANAPIGDVLYELFKDTRISYKIKGDQIVLKKKKESRIQDEDYDRDELVDPGTALAKLKEGAREEIEMYYAYTVSGKVVDETGAPMVGVNVIEKGTANGTSTDSNGFFKLATNDEKATLVFSFIGYTTQEISLSGRSEINVSLVPDVVALQEIVVVGFGTQRKQDLTGAVAVFDSKELENRPNTQFGYALEGKVAGVQVIRPSGQPQAGFSIRVRGTSTITAGSEPQYYVDGVLTSSINEINPADIENITVLKDASSAAIYGASGSNGVVLITTKRGRNQPTRVTFDTYTGFSKAWKKMDVLNATQYKDLMTEMGLTTDWSKFGNTDTDWQDRVFRTAKSQSFNVGVSGGNENTGYYISTSFLKQDGIVITNTVNRQNLKVNLDHKINNIFKVGTSLSYNRWFDVNVDDNAKHSVITSVITGAPVIGVTNADGTYTVNPFIADVENPVALAERKDRGFTNYRFNGNVFAEASFLKDFKFKTMFGFEQYNGQYTSFQDPYHSREGRTFKGLGTLRNTSSAYWLSENTLTYTKSINRHEFAAMAGFITQEKTGSISSMSGRNYSGSGVTTLAGASERTADKPYDFAQTSSSFIGRINYAYADRYLFTTNLRRDGSSQLGPDFKYGYFPSFSVGWKISNESFFQGIDVINDLKIRAGWGKVGNNQIDPYAWYGLVATGTPYFIGNQLVSGTRPSSLENQNLKWESTDQTNIGLDVELLRSRIVFTTDVYVKNTNDMLLQMPVPSSTGFTSSYQNVGKVQNRGIEFSLNTINTTGVVKWTSDFNISMNRNKVVDILGGEFRLGQIANRDIVAIVKEGSPLGSFYGYVADGVSPETGNMKYKDLDNSGGLSDGDKTIIGNANPKYIFGFTNDVKYKNWALSVFIQGVQGNDIFNATRIETEGMIDGRSQSAVVLNRWKNPGDITSIPRSSYASSFNTLISSRFIEDGSFVRVKAITLSYNLPASLLSKARLNKARVYITGENLFTFTKYSGFDPEVSIFGSSSNNTQRNAVPGVDYGTYPQVKDVLVGLNITF